MSTPPTPTEARERMTRRERRHCPHVDVRGIYGDEINAAGGYRNWCFDCKKLLGGPVSIAVERQRLIREKS